LLKLKRFEEVNKYSCSSPSSLLVVKFISIERMDSVFLVSPLAACSLFRLQLQIPFECINFFKKEQTGQRLLFGSRFEFKTSLFAFLLLKFGNSSSISHFVVILMTIVTPHVGRLRILRRLAYNTAIRNCVFIT
jgi:hypothetical protein